MIRLYNAALLPLRALAELWGLWQGLDRGRRVEWAERLVREVPRVAPDGFWLHGASVGEVRLVTELARTLRREQPGRPLAVSAVTVTGRAQLPDRPEVDASFFAPLDFAGLNTKLLLIQVGVAVILIPVMGYLTGRWVRTEAFDAIHDQADPPNIRRSRHRRL